MFIKVTWKDDTRAFIDIDRIELVTKVEKPTTSLITQEEDSNKYNTLIQMYSGYRFWVNETPEEVMELIEDAFMPEM